MRKVTIAATAAALLLAVAAPAGAVSISAVPQAKNPTAVLTVAAKKKPAKKKEKVEYMRSAS